MKNFYKKTLAFTLALLATFSVYSQLEVSQSSFDFGDRERGFFLSKMAYEVTNNGTDTAFITYAHGTAVFTNENVWAHIAPGQTISNFIKLDRSSNPGQYAVNLYLETSLGNATFEVKANIIDNTPTISFNNIYYWVGTGSNKAILEFDFNDGLEKEAFAFGYKFNGTVPAQQMIADIADAFPQLTVDMTGGFLSSVIFEDHSGVSGSPNNWMTMTRLDNSMWETNWGLTTTIDNTEWFGCSYTGVDSDFNPLELPQNPFWSGYPLAVNHITTNEFEVFPNPSSDNVFIDLGNTEINKIQVVDLSGKIVLSENIPAGISKNWLDISNLACGVYQLNVYSATSVQSSKIVKE